MHVLFILVLLNAWGLESDGCIQILTPLSDFETSQCLSFLICKTGIIIVLPPRVVVKIK